MTIIDKFKDIDNKLENIDASPKLIETITEAGVSIKTPATSVYKMVFFYNQSGVERSSEVKEFVSDLSVAWYTQPSYGGNPFTISFNFMQHVGQGTIQIGDTIDRNQVSIQSGSTTTVKNSTFPITKIEIWGWKSS